MNDAKRRLFAAACLGALALAGCTVGPNYLKPQPPAPAGFSEHAGHSPGATLSTVTADRGSLDRWWAQFHDPVLDGLVRRALADNLTLAQARARVRQAREQVAVARAGQLPTLAATTTAARLDTQARTINGLGGAMSSGAGASGASGAAAGSAQGFSTPNRGEYFALGLNAAWELDLFGGVRRQVEAARAQAEAAEWSARDTQVSIASEVANAYLQLRAAQSRAAVLRQDLARQEALFKLVGDRFRTGFVTNLDVDQQRVQLANTQAQIPQVEAQADAQAHALATLLGQTPEALYAELTAPKDLPPVPPTVPAGLPSDLVQRRPDIRAAERQLAAASAQIGVARAQQFPTFNLSLMPSFSRIAISDMFQPPTRTLISLAQGSAPLFQGGRPQAQVRAARAAYDEAFAAYRAASLQALQEVEDAIVRYQADQQRWTALTGAFTAAQRAELIAKQQYAVGLTDYTGVFQAEGSLNSLHDQLVQTDGALATDVVALYKALGGGWEEGETGAAVPVAAQAAAGR